MTSEQRLDRLERIAGLVVKAGLRERRETREKINALIDAQMRTDEAIAHLAHAQANTEENLNALINTVEKIISERGNGKT